MSAEAYGWDLQMWSWIESDRNIVIDGQSRNINQSEFGEL